MSPPQAPAPSWPLQAERTPLAARAYVGPLTWDDAGWRNCLVCEVEWAGEDACFVDAAHPGRSGRLRSWCSHGLRRVSGEGGRLCPVCEGHEACEFTSEFADLLSLYADQILSAGRP